MSERAAGWLLTGPLAFLLAGLIDLAGFTTAALRQAITRRVRSLR